MAGQLAALALTRSPRGRVAVAVGVLLLVLSAGCAKKGAGFTRYVSSPEGLTDRFAAHYHPFWFDYPKDFAVVPNGPENTENLVTVRKAETVGGEQRVDTEFSVGQFWVDDSGPTIREAMPELVDNFKRSVGVGNPGVTVVSEGRTSIGGQDGYQLKVRQQSSSGGRRLIRPATYIPRPGRAPLYQPPIYANDGPVTPGEIHTLRIVLLPAPGNRPFGMVLLGVNRGDDEGQLASVIDSFRFGKP